MADVVGAKIGDDVNISLDFSNFLGEKPVAKLFALMIADMSESNVDFSSNTLFYKDY